MVVWVGLWLRATGIINLEGVAKLLGGGGVFGSVPFRITVFCFGSSVLTVC